MNKNSRDNQTKNSSNSRQIDEKDSLQKLGTRLLAQAYEDNSSQFPVIVSSVLGDYFGPNTEGYIKQIVKIALHLSQRTYSGFYALLFNNLARSCSIEPEFLEGLLQWDLPDFLPEVYRNNNLTSTEQKLLQKRQQKEYQSLLNAFQKSLVQNDKYTRFFRRCEESQLDDNQVDDLYSQCYNQICIQEKLETNNSLADLKEPTYSSPQISHLFEDSPREGRITWTYCLPTKDLLVSLATDRINPLTERPYSSETQRKLRQKFSTELKLIEYALDRISRASS
jgi:hypothetical protein